MTGGLHVKPGSNVAINGIDVQRCVDLAIYVSQGGSVRDLDEAIHDRLATYTPAEHGVATEGAKTLKKVRTAGYSKDICRDALWAKIIDEAQRVKTP